MLTRTSGTSGAPPSMQLASIRLPLARVARVARGGSHGRALHFVSMRAEKEKAEGEKVDSKVDAKGEGKGEGKVDKTRDKNQLVLVHVELLRWGNDGHSLDVDSAVHFGDMDAPDNRIVPVFSSWPEGVVSAAAAIAAVAALTGPREVPRGLDLNAGSYSPQASAMSSPTASPGRSPSPSPSSSPSASPGRGRAGYRLGVLLVRIESSSRSGANLDERIGKVYALGLCCCRAGCSRSHHTPPHLGHGSDSGGGPGDFR